MASSRSDLRAALLRRGLHGPSEIPELRRVGTSRQLRICLNFSSSFLFFNIYLLILAALELSCSMRTP